MNFIKNLDILRKTSQKKKEIIRQLSPCVIEKFSGFKIVRKTCDEKLKNECVPIDIVYFPVKNTMKR